MKVKYNCGVFITEEGRLFRDQGCTDEIPLHEDDNGYLYVLDADLVKPGKPTIIKTKLRQR